MTADVVVVGAGMSGLVAARALAGAGLSVAVLEARERVGGRTESVEVGGRVVDVGGQWLGARHRRLAALADQLAIATFPQHVGGDKILERGGRRATFGGFLPRVPLVDLLELGYRMWSLDRLARSVPLDDPAGAGRAREWDAMTVDDWLGRAVRTAGTRDLVRLAAQMILAAEPREVSFLYFLYYVHSGAGLRQLVEARGGAQDRRFVGGAQQLCQRLADQLGGVVRLRQPVLSVEQDAGGVTAATGSGAVRASRAILALPPALLDRIEFRPALPPERVALHRRMSMGSVVKCIAGYQRPFWREAGFSGEVFSTDGLVRAVFDGCSADGQHAALVAFAVGDGARRLAAMGPDDRRPAVLAELVRHFGPAAARPLGYADKDWSADRWSAGCYVGLAPPGLMTEVGRALRAPCGRVHFAGTETAEEHVGYLEGAIAAGERAAREVIAGLRR